MAAFPDLILDNILARLPNKSLLRCRCVSKHWYLLISDPYFMKSRDRRMIFTTDDYRHVNLINVNNDPTNLMLNLCPPPPFWPGKYPDIRALGAINGIVLLQHYDRVRAKYDRKYEGILMLCNPFTRKNVQLPISRSSRLTYHNKITYAYGFGYGNATPDDLKIFRFIECNKRCRYNDCDGCVCEIFSLKTFTWTTPQDMNIKHIEFEETVGTFSKGYLYWIQYKANKLIVVDVGNILLSEIHLPFDRAYSKSLRLGTIYGCLCLRNKDINDIDFDFNLWVMNDENLWSKTCSFTLPKHHRFVCMLDSGKIVMQYLDLAIYDISDDSYTLTDVLMRCPTRGVEYIETVFSLSDVTWESRLEIKRVHRRKLHIIDMEFLRTDVSGLPEEARDYVDQQKTEILQNLRSGYYDI